MKHLFCLLAKLLFEKNSDYVDMQEVRRCFGLNALESLPEKLFLISVLDRRSSIHSEEVGFYFQRFRDYMISFCVCKWQTLSPEQFKEQSGKISLVTGVRLNALELYYMLANEKHKRILDDTLYGKALNYVGVYERILNTLLLPLKKEFKPYTCGEIGIVGYYDIIGQNMLMHGFRSISQSGPKVIFIPASGRDAINHDGRASMLGANAGLHMTSPSCFTQNMDITKCVIKDEIVGQIKKIIASGKLNENGSLALLSEKLFAIGCTYYPDFVGANPRANGVTIRGFSLAKLKAGLLTQRAYRILKNELIGKKVDTGEILVRHTGRTDSFFASVSDTEEKELWRKAIQIGKIGEFYSPQIIYASEDKFEKEVLGDIEIFEQAEITEILDPLATRRKNLMQFNEMRWGYKIDVEYAQKFLCELLETAYKEYKRIIDSNFPSMRKVFKYMDEKPVKMFVTLTPRDRDLEYELWAGYPIEDVNYDFSVEAREEALKIYWDSRDAFEEISGEKYKILYSQSGFLSDLLTPSTNYHTFKSTEYLTVIRNLVYKLISKNVDSLINALAERADSVT